MNNKINPNFENIFINTQTQLDEIKQIIMDLKNNPKIILTNVFSDGKYQAIIRLLDNLNEIKIHDFQKYAFEILIDFLQKELGEELTFQFDKYMYKSDISIKYNNFEIGHFKLGGKILWLNNIDYQIKYYDDLSNRSKNLIDESNKYILDCQNKLESIFNITKNPFKIISLLFNNYKLFYNNTIQRYKNNIEFYIKHMLDSDKHVLELTSLSNEIKILNKKIKNYFEELGYQVINHE